MRRENGGAIRCCGVSDAVALVTGASARIGLAVATRLAGAGYAVALHASPRGFAAAQEHAGAIVREGGRACALVADLADGDACGELVGAAAHALGRLTLLVNNAAIFVPDDAFGADHWDRHMVVNLRAPVLLSQSFVGQARPGSSIVNLLDQRVLQPGAREFSYSLSKSALWSATQAMAQAFAPHGVRVNAVGPGPVLPNSHDGEAGFARERAALPLARAVDVGDVADAVLYLAKAAAVTGQLVAVDGGQHLG